MCISSVEYSELCPHGAGILPIITSVQGISQLLTRGTFTSALLSTELTVKRCLACLTVLSVIVSLGHHQDKSFNIVEKTRVHKMLLTCLCLGIQGCSMCCLSIYPVHLSVNPFKIYDLFCLECFKVISGLQICNKQD